MLVKRLFNTGWPEKQIPRDIFMKRGVNTESVFELVFDKVSSWPTHQQKC